MLSKHLENYLKAIWHIQNEKGACSTSALAKYLGVSSASVSSMLKKLRSKKLVNYVPYKGATMTPRGEKAALEIIRHHRLLELYLSEELKFPLDQVHAEAEELEHTLSEELETVLFEKLGRPTRDPHGDPIPTKDGRVETVGKPLLEAPPDRPIKVIRVRDRNPDILKYLAQLGLLPGTMIIIVEKLPFDGPFRIRIGDAEHILSRAVSQEIYVSAFC